MHPMLQLNQVVNPVYDQIKPGNWIVRKPGPKGQAFRPHDTGRDDLSISILAVRQKAVDFANQEKAIVSYDLNSTLFKKIARQADAVSGSRCQHGPEMLVWMHEASHCGLATLYGGSKTQRMTYLLHLQRVALPPAPGLWNMVILSRREQSFGEARGRPPYRTHTYYTPVLNATPFWWKPEELDLEDKIRAFLNPPKTWGYELSSRLQAGYERVDAALDGYNPQDRRAILRVFNDRDEDE